MALALDVLGERWTLLVVRELLRDDKRPKRFGELLAELPGISRHLLTRRLRELEEAGVVTRHPSRSGPRARAWELTPLGHELEAALWTLGRWGLRHGEFRRATANETAEPDSPIRLADPAS